MCIERVCECVHVCVCAHILLFVRPSQEKWQLCVYVHTYYCLFGLHRKNGSFKFLRKVNSHGAVLHDPSVYTFFWGVGRG